MVSKKIKKALEGSSVIRAMFTEGKEMAKKYGAENVYDFSLAYTDDLINVSPYDTAVYSDAAADCDITYTVSETGYTERRENNWLK